jgi:hypothetical protein
LAASAGLVLDPWQCDVLTGALGEREDGRWSAFEVGLVVGRQNGKGAILEARELAGLFLFGEQLILHSAHEFKTAAEAFRRVLSLVENTDDLRKHVRKVQIGHGDEGIELRTGARLRFVARSTGSGRGFSGDLVILDEAYALTGKQIEALLPTMSARPNPQLWYTSSPSLDADSGAFLMGVRDRGREGAEHLAYFDYGAAGDLENLADIDLDNRDLWRATNPAYGIRITEEFIKRERAAMSDEGFARERLCIWPRPRPLSGGVISDDLWRSRLDTTARRPTDIALSAVVNYRRTHSAIMAVGARPDGGLLCSVMDYRPGTHWLVERTAELKARWNPVAIAVQDKGPTGSLLDDFARAGLLPSEDKDQPRRGEIAIPWADDVADAYGMFIDAITQGRLWHLDETPLNLAVSATPTRSLSGGTAWEYKGATDPSPLLAATFALWAYLTRHDKVIAGEKEPGVWEL